MVRGGQIGDLLFMLVWVFFLAAFFLVMFIVWDETDDAIQATDMDQDAKDLFHTQATAYPTYIDYSFLTIYAALIIGILILSYFLRTTPILFWALWVLVMVVSAVAGYMANAWEEFTSGGLLATAAAGLPIIDFVMSNYLTMTVVVGLLMLVVYFAKPPDGFEVTTL